MSADKTHSGYELVIGLEVHAQLKTRTKIFCSCPVEYGGEPNTNVCPVCLGLPGVLPVLDDEVVRLAIRTGLALGCSIAPRSRFARKHYFYPDLPKGYQITQYLEPLAFDGWLDIPGKRVKVRRCHIEEDAGKLVHAGTLSLVDFNRCGVPLIEIVSDPDLRTAEEAEVYVNSLRRILQYLNVSDADMEKGHFRAELNLSVRPKGSQEFFTQTEVKNLNSVRALKGAIEYEAKRQIELHERREPVKKQTLLWDDKTGETAPMRSKETAEDYRYFQEPDLPPLVIRPEEVEEIRARLPELPAQRLERYVTKLGLSEYDASVITADPDYADYYEAILKAGADPKPAANWLTTEVAGALNEQGIGIQQFKVEPDAIAELIGLLKAGRITGKAAKEVFAEMVAIANCQSTTVRDGIQGLTTVTITSSPAAIVEAKGLGLVADDDLLNRAVDEVIAAEPSLVAKYKSGKTTVLGALVGAVMKKSHGKFPPQKVSELLVKELNK